MNKRRLKYVASIVAGQSPSGEDVTEAGDFPFLQGCAEFGDKYPVPTKFCSAPPKRAQKGAWLISVRAPVGQLNYADQDYGIGRGVAGISAKTIDRRFLGYILRHSVATLRSIATGSTYDAVSAGQVGNLSIPYPDLATQQSIADFLDREIARIDQLIEKREAFLSLIDEKKASLAVNAVDGSILDGVAKGVEGWFGGLPESWQARRAKFLFRERQDRSDSGEEELLTVSHITGVTRRSDKDVNMFLAESTEGYKLVSEGDVVINTMWAWMGAMGVSPVEGLISPSYGIYAPRCDAFEADYLDLLLRSRPFVAEATRRSKGIHSSRLRLYPDAFLDILLPVPSREAQRGILTALRVATEREEQLATLSCLSLGRLREFRAALITAAVTGQIDVARWGKRGTTDRRLDVIESNAAAAAQPEQQQARA